MHYYIVKNISNISLIRDKIINLQYDTAYMKYNREHRKTYSQNFVKNPALIRYVLNKIDIPEQSLVIDIGAGEGIITQELQKKFRVWAIEKDSDLAYHLKKTLPKTTKVHNIDIRAMVWPKESFWVVANPPFQIFSQIIKHVIWNEVSPEGFLIFGQKEAVYRLIGKLQSSALSTTLRAFYQVDIVHQFQATDFSPAPNVDVVLVRAYKISTSLFSHKQDFIRFVKFGFEGKKARLAGNFSSIFTFDQWKRLAGTYRFDPKAKPSELDISQWKGIFAYYKDHVSQDKWI